MSAWSNLPNRVRIREVGPRDGFQYEPGWIPTETKVETVNRLSRTGLREIQVTSFVHPKATPQLRDAEEVMARIERMPGVKYSVLIPNLKGATRAIPTRPDCLNLLLSATDSHSLANANSTTADALKKLAEVVEAAGKAGIPVSGGMSVALGCPFEGFPPIERLFWVVDEWRAMGLGELEVADTAGMANPALVYDRLSRLRDRCPDVTWGLHLHDTRRMATGNILAALQAGVTFFDASVGGLGGCPYCPGATGNIATEDLVHMLHEMGIETGIDLDALIDVARWVGESVVKHPLDSSVARAGPSSKLLGKRTTGQEKVG
jgi:hydroxymethylglutaryl-CoA lyase